MEILVYVVVTEKGSRDVEKRADWYFGFLFSFEIFLLFIMCQISWNCSFRMFSNEDVTIGAWMLAMNVNHENEKALCQPDCTPTSIAVWDIPKCSGWCLLYSNIFSKIKKNLFLSINNNNNLKQNSSLVEWKAT